jgi:hypothetical protein
VGSPPRKKRMKRSERSRTVDCLLRKITKQYSFSRWTVRDLRKYDINLTRGLIKYLHESGFIKKHERVRSPDSAIYWGWSLTEKGKYRGEE